MNVRTKLVWATLVVTTTLAAARGFAAVPETLAPDQLVPGQKAIVRTVFQGTTIEDFDAEIVGVLAGGRAGGDIIVARATSEKAIRSGIAQGMSGSPVYVDGKLIGALSSGWAFSREPVFGITPIGEMLDVLHLPRRTPTDNTAGPSGIDPAGAASTGLSYRGLKWEMDDDAVGDDAPPDAPPTPVDASASGIHRLALPVACTGLHPGARDLVRRLLAPYGLAAVPGGRAPKASAAAAPDATLEPGSAVAVELLRGDLQIAAIGTVTYRDGDHVLLFGHPFFQSGDVRLPLAVAEITTVIPNQQFSFKLGVQGREAGVATQDRRAAVAGEVGPPPRLLPVAITVAGMRSEEQHFRFETIEDRQMAPLLVSIAAVNGLLESGGFGGNQTLRWTLTLHRPRAAAFTLSDVVAGDSPSGEVSSDLATPLQFLFNNPYQRLALDSITVRIAAEPGREQWTLRNARVLDPAVRPGGTVRVEAEIERWRGGRETRTIALQIPDDAPDGRYRLWLGGGTELSRYEAARLPGRYRVTSLEDAWKRLTQLLPTDMLYASVFARAPEITTDGRDYPELPLSALAMLATDQATGESSRRGDLVRLAERRVPVSGALRGELQLAITVDSKAP